MKENPRKQGIREKMILHWTEGYEILITSGKGHKTGRSGGETPPDPDRPPILEMEAASVDDTIFDDFFPEPTYDGGDWNDDLRAELLAEQAAEYEAWLDEVARKSYFQGYDLASAVTYDELVRWIGTTRGYLLQDDWRNN